MDMQMGDEKYHRLIRRWSVLSYLDNPTDDQRKEMREIDQALYECELRHVRGPIAPLVDDYMFAVGQAGDLGGTEIL